MCAGPASGRLIPPQAFLVKYKVIPKMLNTYLRSITQETPADHTHRREIKRAMVREEIRVFSFSTTEVAARGELLHSSRWRSPLLCSTFMSSETRLATFSHFHYVRYVRQPLF